MTKKRQNKMVEMPNILLIAGNGRNVGKTFLACEIIKHWSKTDEIIGLKISPHFHEIEKGNVIIQNADFIIVEETQFNRKDSSLMLKAGAKKVYFVMAGQKNLEAAFLQLETLLPNTAIVCESGGLHQFVNPGIFLFVKNKYEEIVKPHLLNYSPTVVENNGSGFNFYIEKIKYNNNRFSMQ